MALLMLSLAKKLEDAFASQSWFRTTEKRFDTSPACMSSSLTINVAEGNWKERESRTYQPGWHAQAGNCGGKKQRRRRSFELAADEPSVATLLGNKRHR
jgi:hypothetical protein